MIPFELHPATAQSIPPSPQRTPHSHPPGPSQSILGQKRHLRGGGLHDFMGGKSRKLEEGQHAPALELYDPSVHTPAAPVRSEFSSPSQLRPQRPLPTVPLTRAPNTHVASVPVRAPIVFRKAEVGSQPTFMVDPQPATPHGFQTIKRQPSFKVLPQASTPPVVPVTSAPHVGRQFVYEPLHTGRPPPQQQRWEHSWQERLQQDQLPRQQHEHLQQEHPQREQREWAQFRQEPHHLEHVQRDELEHFRQEQARREELERERCHQEQLRREQTAREQEEYERFRQDQARREELERERCHQEQLRHEQTAREQEEYERFRQEQAQRVQFEREQEEYERFRQEQHCLEQVQREQLERFRQEEARWEELERERCQQEQLRREQAGREQIMREQAAREQMREQEEYERFRQEQARRDELEHERCQQEQLRHEYIYRQDEVSPTPLGSQAHHQHRCALSQSEPEGLDEQLDEQLVQQELEIQPEAEFDHKPHEPTQTGDVEGPRPPLFDQTSTPFTPQCITPSFAPQTSNQQQDSSSAPPKPHRSQVDEMEVDETLDLPGSIRSQPMSSTQPFAPQLPTTTRQAEVSASSGGLSRLPSPSVFTSPPFTQAVQSDPQQQSSVPQPAPYRVPSPLFSPASPAEVTSTSQDKASAQLVALLLQQGEQTAKLMQTLVSENQALRSLLTSSFAELKGGFTEMNSRLVSIEATSVKTMKTSRGGEEEEGDGEDDDDEDLDMGGVGEADDDGDDEAELASKRKSQKPKKLTVFDDPQLKPGIKNLQNCVRQQLFFLYDVTSMQELVKKSPPITDEEMQSFEEGEDDLLTCSVQHFRLDFIRPWKDNQFNQLAKNVFVKSLITMYKGGQYPDLDIPSRLLTERIVGIVLDKHMEYRRRRYRECMTPLSEEAVNRVKARKAMNSRRASLLDSRIWVVLEFELKQHKRLFKMLRPIHMSGDETDGEKTHPPTYRIVECRWQSLAFKTFLQALDVLYHGRWKDGKPVGNRATAGNPPRTRVVRPDGRVEDGVAPIGLWRNCYDGEWLRSLRPHVRSSLKIIDADYKFILPPPPPATEVSKEA